MKKFKGFVVLLAIMLVLSACGKGSSQKSDGDSGDQVVLLTNADEEAVNAWKETLDEAGYEGKYIIQSLATSELGGKLMAEGKTIQADLITMSTYFLQSAQDKHEMFADLSFETKAIEEHPSYYLPILGNTGAIFVNTEVMKANNLPVPASIKDLTDPVYEGFVSIPNITDSSTAWLMVQAVIDAYGEEEGQEVLEKLVKNVGPHLESSGSGPIKKVQSGEVALGFGLRHQAVIAQESGAPIEFIDPVEGNFSLTEAVAVVNKESGHNELAMEMAEVLMNDSRAKMIDFYPVALYEGESVDSVFEPAYSKSFPEPLTVELLEKHQAFFNAAK
ncbi:extracellular solute-binding protein [Ornithinibacillus sp. 4-3]|uniref:Extracellular solute-binding protein n=1 Tax=Ornithinibacillus sp. 4-3 TaxID=3231488 RepID=A0AB39HM37_9BACI